MKVEEEETTLGFPEEPKLEVSSPPLSPGNSDDESTEPDESDGEEEEGSAAGAGAGRAVVTGPPLKKGPWTPVEDRRLRTYVEAHGEGLWNTVQRNAGLNRCGKSCRLRWANHLRPHLKKGPFSKEEEQKIIELHAMHGNKWAKMATALPGRTDNEIKNFWNTRSKRLSKAGLDLYPDGLLSRVANQDMDCHSPEDSRGKKRPNELSQGSGPEFEDIVFEKLDYKKRAENFLAPTFIIPDSIPVDGMNHPLKSHASTAILSGYSRSPTYEQFPHEAEKTCYTDINPGIARNHSFPFNNAIPNGPPILDGNFSTSGTLHRPMKMELPLIQHTSFEAINSCWSPPFHPATPLELADKYNVSPASVLTKPECFPSQDNGLLDAMVHQGHVPTKFQGAYEGLVPRLYVYPSPASSVFGDNLLEGSPLDEFRTSQSRASLDALLRDCRYQADDMSVEKYLLPDPCMLDASSEAGFLNEDSPHSEFQPMNGQLNAQLFGGSFDEVISSASGDGHQLGLESATWKSMPGACHMSECRNGNQQQL